MHVLKRKIIGFLNDAYQTCSSLIKNAIDEDANSLTSTSFMEVRDLFINELSVLSENYAQVACQIQIT